MNLKNKTIWQAVCDWFDVHVWGTVKRLEYLNPLNIDVNKNYITVTGRPDIQGNFRIKTIEELTRTIEGDEFKIVDYLALLDGRYYKFRLVPNEESYDVLFLEATDEFKYDENFHKCSLLGQIFNQHTEKWEADPKYENDFCVSDEPDKPFWRVNDVSTPYEAEKLRVNTKGCKISRIEYWDYYRELDKVVDFLIVEMDAANGYFEIWRGGKLNLEQLTII